LIVSAIESLSILSREDDRVFIVLLSTQHNDRDSQLRYKTEQDRAQAKSSRWHFDWKMASRVGDGEYTVRILQSLLPSHAEHAVQDVCSIAAHLLLE
jgi:hypothetical protein